MVAGDVQPDQRPQTLLWIGDAPHGIQHALLGNLHGMVHDLEQDFILAMEMMVKAALAQFERRRDIIHGSSVIASLLK